MRRIVQLVGIVGVAVAIASIAGGAADEGGEWRAYGGTKASTKYSPLDQINQDTVRNLRIAWRQSALPAEVRRSRPDARVPVPKNYQHTPLMVGGVLYMSSGDGSVAALDPATGKVVWFDEGPRPDGAVASRGVAYWTDGTDARIITLMGRSLVALNAKTGKRYPGFGLAGAVDLGKGYERPGTTEGFKWGGPPLVVRDVIVIGGMPPDASDILNDTQLATREAPPGDIRGYDVRTGKQLWTFHVVPHAGEFGNDTWLESSWEYSGNSGVWGIMSGDDELGYAYLPLETPRGDMVGGARPGANLFAESLLCLDVRTGKRVWHFQAVHHGIWDYDFTSPPILVDITVKGRKIKAVAEVSKQSYIYVFDRVTGQPVWPIVERPVPKGDIPGEWYSPTQPVPLNADGQPFAFDQQGVTIDDLVDFTPELRKEALEIVNRYHYGPLFTPLLRSGTSRGKNGTIIMPGPSGGANWTGAGVDPETGIVYVPSAHTAAVIELVPSKHKESNLPYVRRRCCGASGLDGPRGLPDPFKPPYARLVAIDLNQGRVLWTVANGDGPRNHPALKSLNLPPLGQPGRASPLVTKTLVFLGEGFDGPGMGLPPGAGGKKFRAYDKKTGKVVWETDLPAGTTGAPMTYMAGGKQYIAVAVGSTEMPAEIVALALP